MRSSGFFMALCLSAALTAAGCSTKGHDADRKPVESATIVKGTTTETVKTAAIAETIEVVGTVRARTSAVVSPRIPGTISMLRVREGDRVKKGQLLAQLDAPENQATAAAAFAGIDDARRSLDEALARKKLADSTFERYHKLFNEQAVTRQEFDIKQTEKELAAQGVARAEARLKQSQEGSRAAATIADYTKIVAPISGLITSKQADLGASIFPGQPLMTIEDDGSYQLELAVPESQATGIRTGTAVSITLDSIASSFSSTISEIVPAADPASRTILAKATLARNGLKSGMFGRGAINLGTAVNAITAPKASIVERGALTSLWIVDKDGIARMRLVKTGKTVGERVVILSGLSDGEKIVVGGAEKVSEGAKVE